MRYIQLSLFIFLLLVTFITNAANRIVEYGPTIVELKGIIDIKVSPGPPNYEDIKKGDVAETGYYLKLEEPVDVVLPPNLPKDGFYSINEPEKNIPVIQLVVQHNTDWPKMKKGNHLRLVGTLFRWHTGHHHTRVLMLVDNAFYN